MAYTFDVVETQAQPALAIRTVTSVDSLPQEIGKAYGAVLAYLKERGEQALGPAFVAYHNMDMQKLDVEMGFPVAKETAGNGDILATHIPAGKRATCMYKGPYKGMASTYEAMTKWMSDNGHVPTGVVYEFYYNSPADVPESELLTKIEFLLK